MILRADARALPLADGVVQTCVTSPPYFGLRDYGVSGQIGLEETPEQFIETMVEVFREVRRVLRDDGTLWLNLGDSYASQGGFRDYGSSDGGTGRGFNSGRRGEGTGYKPKDLMGMPWRVAFALQADGWWLRSDIIWAKPNPMPESVTDRPTRSHEYIFLLTKSERYYYDADAIREPHISDGRGGFSNKETLKAVRFGQVHAPSLIDAQVNPAGRNKRDVWTINSEPCPEAHFATFPQKLVEPCILAGTSAKGECSICGANWVRESSIPYDESHPTYNEWRKTNARGKFADGERVQGDNKGEGGTVVAYYRTVWNSEGSPKQTTGWRPSCDHNAPVVPCLVYDPFGGSGTVGKVCEALGRRWVMTELSEPYIEIARKRTAQRGLFA